MTRAITSIGRDLRRPECVLATRSGDLFTSGFDRGVTRIAPDGGQFHLAPPTDIDGVPTLANGIALLPDGRFLVANIADGGGLFALDAEGYRLFHPCSETGTPPPVNFVMVDHLGKIWITVSSTFSPRSLAYRRDVANGYVGVIENGTFRVVVDKLAYTNEIRADYENGWLYIVETMAQKISRIRLDERGVHGPVETFATMPAGAFVDGIEVDAEGAVLAACIISNELFRITPDGSRDLVIGERVDDWVETVETAFDAGELGRPHLDQAPTELLRNIASVTFMGPALDRLVCGVLLDDRLPSFDAPAPGRRPIHWDAPPPDWGEPF